MTTTTRIGLVIDSNCDLPDDYLAEHGIAVLPITIKAGPDSFMDERNPDTTRQFFASPMLGAADAESEALTPEEIRDFLFARVVPHYDHVFMLTSAASRSPEFEHARRAVNMVVAEYRGLKLRPEGAPPFAVRVLDTGNLFAGQAISAVEVVRMIGAGSSPTEIRDRLDYLMPNTYCYAVPASLQHLRDRSQVRGDKSVNWWRYMVGTVLDLHPFLVAHRGHTGPVGRMRGYEASVERLFDFARERLQAGLLTPTLCVGYVGDPATLDTLPGFAALRQAAETLGVEVLTATMGCPAAIHVGPGTVEVAFAAPPHEFTA